MQRRCSGAAGLGDCGGRDLTKTSGRLPGRSCGRWRCQHRPRGCGGQSLRPGHRGHAWHPQGLINRQRRSVAGSNAARGFPSLCQSTRYGAAPDASDAGPQRPLPSKPTPLRLRPLLLPEVPPLRPQGPPVPRLVRFSALQHLPTPPTWNAATRSYGTAHLLSFPVTCDSFSVSVLVPLPLPAP